VYQATVFKDGINADRDATDYNKEVIPISLGAKVNIHLAPGGGCAIRLVPVGSIERK
jgi:alpha-glucosidase